MSRQRRARIAVTFGLFMLVAFASGLGFGAPADLGVESRAAGAVVGALVGALSLLVCAGVIGLTCAVAEWVERGRDE